MVKLIRAEDLFFLKINFAELNVIFCLLGKQSKKVLSYRKQCDWIKCAVAEYVHAGDQKRISKSLCYVNEVILSFNDRGKFNELLEKVSEEKASRRQKFFRVVKQITCE